MIGGMLYSIAAQVDILAFTSDLSYRGRLGEGTEGPRGRGQGG
jgi:hypothetical protein